MLKGPFFAPRRQSFHTPGTQPSYSSMTQTGYQPRAQYSAPLCRICQQRGVQNFHFHANCPYKAQTFPISAFYNSTRDPRDYSSYQPRHKYNVPRGAPQYNVSGGALQYSAPRVTYSIARNVPRYQQQYNVQSSVPRHPVQWHDFNIPVMSQTYPEFKTPFTLLRALELTTRSPLKTFLDSPCSSL